MVLVHEGVPMEDRMRKVHINTEGSAMQRDTRTARTHGPDPLRDLEKSGGISVLPWSEAS